MSIQASDQVVAAESSPCCCDQKFWLETSATVARDPPEANGNRAGRGIGRIVVAWDLGSCVLVHADFARAHTAAGSDDYCAGSRRHERNATRPPPCAGRGEPARCRGHCGYFYRRQRYTSAWSLLSALPLAPSVPQLTATGAAFVSCFCPTELARPPRERSERVCARQPEP